MWEKGYKSGKQDRSQVWTNKIEGYRESYDPKSTSTSYWNSKTNFRLIG